MKKFLALFLAASIMTTNVCAAEITVTLDGDEVIFQSTEPVIENGRTLIPLRGVFEQLGYEISWDGNTKTAVFQNEGNTIEITANSDTFIMNGEAVSLDVPASIIDGSMMLPLRAVGEAAGLVVNWDADTKTVSLSTGSAETEAVTEAETVETTEAETEAATEEETETTTAAAVKDNISEADAEKLKICANNQSTIYSIDVLYYYLGETLEYAYYKIDGALEYSYSTAELVEVFDDAIEECKGYKAAANRLKTLTADQTLVKAFVAYVDDQITYLQFYYDVFCSVKYSSSSELSVNKKIDDMKRDLEEALSDMNSAAKNLTNAANDTIRDETYNAEASEKISSEKQAGMEKYRKEIGAYVTDELNKVKNTSDAYRNGSAFVTAATNIRNKLNSTETPTYCLLDKYCLLRACDLITQAGTAVKNGAYTKDGKNEYYIEYLAVMITADYLFECGLGDYYDPSEGEFEEVPEEADIDIEEEGITV
ncbi:MAG: copper amine oxidase N-terminal domain-containing protein [Clostridiales bacterium]|nr:copper amine oxidase N-terminal domain-containing protein [Clostridiales bacterium]